MTKALAVQNYLRKPYIRLVIPDEDGSFIAEILEFEGCFAEGKSAAQALKNLEKTAAVWLEAKLEDRAFIPEPAGNVEMSGRFALRMPQSLHQKAAIFAEREGVSLNTFIVNAIAGNVGMLDLFDRLVIEFTSRTIISDTKKVALAAVTKGTLGLAKMPDEGYVLNQTAPLMLTG